VLLLDHREVGAGREHATRDALLNDLAAKLGAGSVEARALPLSDMLWVWRGGGAAGGAPREELAGWAVERKTFHDLGASIVDGRYDEQKARLLGAPGLDGGVVYLVEGAGPLFGVSGAPGGDAEPSGGHGSNRGFGQRLLSRSLPVASLATAATHTQMIAGLHVVHTTSTAKTVAFLVAMHRALQAEERGGPCDRRRDPVSYHDFADRTRKSCHARVFEAFGRMLRVIPHCGPEATEALVDEFQTPHAFAAALRNSSDTELLLRLKERRAGRAPVSAAALLACRELFGV